MRIIRYPSAPIAHLNASYVEDCGWHMTIWYRDESNPPRNWTHLEFRRLCGEELLQTIDDWATGSCPNSYIGVSRPQLPGQLQLLHDNSADSGDASQGDSSS